MKDTEKPLVTATLGDLLEVLKPFFPSRGQYGDAEEQTGKRYVYGIKGLAKLIKCSQSTAQRRLSSGVLDHCVIRTGRLLIIDEEAALDALNNHY